LGTGSKGKCRQEIWAKCFHWEVEEGGEGDGVFEKMKEKNKGWGGKGGNLVNDGDEVFFGPTCEQYF
jgi:hypothetical protein